MKLTILTENHASGHFLAEHGLSYLIECDDKTVLFDTGHSDVFIQNALKININLHECVDLIVLSHGHWDHGNGLFYLPNKPLLTHPAAFMKRYRKKDHSPVGLKFSKDDLHYNFELLTSAAPVQLSEKLFYLGEIPRLNNFESQTTTFSDEAGKDDFVPDDSALAFVGNDGLTIVSGCAHSGICNICEHAKKITGISKIHAVIGGFHLKENDEQTKQTIRYFEKEKVEKLMPSHCTELPALAAFQIKFHIQQQKTGMVHLFKDHVQP